MFIRYIKLHACKLSPLIQAGFLVGGDTCLCHILEGIYTSGKKDDIGTSLTALSEHTEDKYCRPAYSGKENSSSLVA